MMQSVDRYYITTPIYYVNGSPHLGHAYTTVVADALTRFARLEGKEAFFLTGTDEHGEKIVQSAEAKGIEPQQWVDEISGLFRALWPTLNIQYDDFIRTTEERHVRIVQRILKNVYDAGDIYYGEYGGNYCVGCERFLEEDELVDGKCPDHGIEPKFVNEANYFFRMSKYQDWLIGHIKANPEFIRPEQYRNEILSFLKKPLKDLCISRPKSRLSWGIELPFDANFVTYVWFDALVNYVSALGWPDGEKFARYWPSAQHVTAKDIIKPHGIYWPCMLQSAGIPVYQHLNVHGFWRGADGRKMSKSLGNSVDPTDIRNRFGADVFRYVLLREMPYGQDANIGEEIIAIRQNTDLANDFGNLISRTIKLVFRAFDGIVPAVAETHAEDAALRDQWVATLPTVREAWHELRMSHGIETVIDCVKATNRYFDAMRPWELAKNGNIDRLATVLATALDAIRVASVLLTPVMPERMAELRRQLGISAPPTLAEAESWGGFPPGHRLVDGPGLFPRVDIDEVRAREAARIEAARTAVDATQQNAGTVAEQEVVTIDEFRRIHLRIGTILSAEPVPKAAKLFRLKVDIGEASPRQLVAGIAEHYQAETLVGKQVVVVANLRPAVIRGIESHGMILAADTDCGLALLEPDKAAPNGQPIR
jgi:methionyl-tRNA synthetase